MEINIVVKPSEGHQVRFGSYNTIGEALHIASSLERHMRFRGQVWVEETPGQAQMVLTGATVVKYEIT